MSDQQPPVPHADAPVEFGPSLTTGPRAERVSRQTLRYVDDRLSSASFLRRTFNKVFPDHWSFMLGEIALYSFIILLLTGVYLTFFFQASSQEVVYNGSYLPLRGVQMTQAYASTLHISFDVRAGLIIRQIHHWAALLFVSAIIVHLMRVFFTGAFRKPREVNWLIGVSLLVLAILEGFAGYSLPDDLLSGTGIRIAYSVIESIPIVGTWLAYLVFGTNYPGTDFIPRLFIIHVLLVPGILLALISAHLMILWHQKHTDFPGRGKSERTVVGTAFFPGFMLKSQGFFFAIFGVLALLGGFAQINPVWLYGPYTPAQVSAGSQPDWYIGFLEGSLRLMPNWEWNFLGHTIDFNVLIPAVILPGLMFTLLAVYPFLEQWVTRDRAFHDVLDRPRDRPGRTAAGVMALTFYLVLLVAGGNDVLAKTFDLSLQATTWVLRVMLIVLPPLSFYVTRRICLGLQQRDHHLVEEGVETGRIVRLPSGEYIELTTPLPADRLPLLTAAHPELVGEHRPAVTAAVPNGERRAGRRGNGGMLGGAQRALERFFYRDKAPDQPTEPEGPRTLTRS